MIVSEFIRSNSVWQVQDPDAEQFIQECLDYLDIPYGTGAEEEELFGHAALVEELEAEEYFRNGVPITVSSLQELAEQSLNFFRFNFPLPPDKSKDRLKFDFPIFENPHLQAVVIALRGVIKELQVNPTAPAPHIVCTARQLIQCAKQLELATLVFRDWHKSAFNKKNMKQTESPLNEIRRNYCLRATEEILKQDDYYDIKKLITQVLKKLELDLQQGLYDDQDLQEKLKEPDEDPLPERSVVTRWIKAATSQAQGYPITLHYYPALLDLTGLYSPLLSTPGHPDTTDTD